MSYKDDIIAAIVADIGGGDPVEHNDLNEGIATRYVKKVWQQFEKINAKPTEAFWQSEAGQMLACVQWWLHDNEELLDIGETLATLGFSFKDDPKAYRAAWNRLMRNPDLRAYRRPEVVIERRSTTKRTTTRQGVWYWLEEDVLKFKKRQGN